MSVESRLKNLTDGRMSTAVPRIVLDTNVIIASVCEASPLHWMYDAIFDGRVSFWDDNIFADAAIAAGADCLVTNDSHFQVLATTSFPSVAVITSDTLQRIV